MGLFHIITHGSVPPFRFYWDFHILGKLKHRANPRKCSSLFLYLSQNFPAAINLREQYMIFWRMCCHRTCTCTQIKHLKYLPIVSKRPFPRLEISPAPSLSCILPFLQRFLRVTCKDAAAYQSVPGDAGGQGLNIRWGRRTKRPCSTGRGNTEIRHPGSVPGFVLLLSLLNVDWF